MTAREEERLVARRRDSRGEMRAVLTTGAIRVVLDALNALDFDERRRVLRWAADFYAIDPTKLNLG